MNSRRSVASRTTSFSRADIRFLACEVWRGRGVIIICDIRNEYIIRGKLGNKYLRNSFNLLKIFIVLNYKLCLYYLTSECDLGFTETLLGLFFWYWVTSYRFPPYLPLAVFTNDVIILRRMGVWKILCKMTEREVLG